MVETRRPPARERVLDAADRLFSAHGIAATGVDAVLAEAGVAPATLYAHFAGKDALVAAYLQRRHERWRQTWDERLAAAGDDADERLLAVFDALASNWRERPEGRGCAFLAAAVEITAVDHPAHAWLEADTELLVSRMRELASEAGIRDPVALADELLAVYDGALAARARRRVTGRAPDPDARALASAAIARHRSPAEVG